MNFKLKNALSGIAYRACGWIHVGDSYLQACRQATKRSWGRGYGSLVKAAADAHPDDPRAFRKEWFRQVIKNHKRNRKFYSNLMRGM